MSENEDPLDFFLKQLIIGSGKEGQIEESLNLFAAAIIDKDCIQPNRVRIPYHAITQYIYNYESEIDLEDITLSLDAREMWIESDISSLEGDDVKLKIRECFHKTRDHIVLAVIQKNHIQKAARDADDIAQNAKNIAKEAKTISVKAEQLANEADAQAKSTIANYISILGIFASIIFTLFGGVNLIGATVKLLEANSRWPYLTFIIALLMICLLTLLNMMIKWVGSMNDLKGALDRIKSGVSVQEVGSPKELNFWEKYIGFGFYTRAVLILSVVLGVSMVGMYNVNKENIFSYSTEKTQKNIAKPDESTKSKSVEKSDQGSSSNSNLETTVVEKITISNKPNSEPKDDDKKD